MSKKNYKYRVIITSDYCGKVANEVVTKVYAVDEEDAFIEVIGLTPDSVVIAGNGVYFMDVRCPETLFIITAVVVVED